MRTQVWEVDLRMPKILGLSAVYPSLDPPKSPLKRGTLNTLVPPFLRGARGDLASDQSEIFQRFQAIVDTNSFEPAPNLKTISSKAYSGSNQRSSDLIKSINSATP